MKSKNLLLAVFVFTSAFCHFTSYMFSQGAWTVKTPFPTANGREGAAAFSIGTKGYIGLGYDNTPPQTFFNDLWEWDQATNAWTQMTNFPGGGRWESTCFTIGNKGYVACGWDGSLSLNYNTLWEYDPGANSWNQKTNRPGAAREGAAGFSIGTKGYVCAGRSTNPSGAYQDLWEWEQTTDTWTQKTNYAGGIKAYLVGIAICGKGYVGTGSDGPTIYNEWWEYDPVADTWTPRTPVPGPVRAYATAFPIGNKGYVGTGWNFTNGLLNDFWEYDPASNSWAAQANISGPRDYAVSFVIGNFGYVSGGWIGSGNNYYNDLQEFSPTSITSCSGCTAPTVIASSNVTICTGQTTTLTITASGGVSPYTYQWSPIASLSNPNISNPVASPTTTTTYTVLVTEGAGCTNTAQVTVTVNSLPVASAGADVTICPGANTTLMASGGGTYLWNTGATTSFILVNPTVTTAYTVTVTNACGSSTDAVNVVVSNSIIASISGNTAICSGQNTTLTAAGGTNYSWNTTATTAAITVSPTTNTTYSVIVSSGSCSDTAAVTVSVTATPVATISGAVTICTGNTVTLTASGGGNYSWSTNATTSSITISPASTISYSVIVSNGSCADTASVAVTVISSPSVSVSGNTILCTGDIATLTASGGGNYLWSNGSTSTIINVSPSATTTYSVVTSNGSCSDTASVTVTVSPPPIAFASGATVCSGQIAALTASGGASYSWSNGATTSSISITPSSTSTYSVIVSIGSCSDTASTTVVVNPNPAAVAWSNTTITAGSSTTLSASGGTNYSWSNGAITSTTTVGPAVTTVYCVTVTDNNGCTDSECVTVFVEQTDCSNAGELFLPNAFSPNGDGENDVLQLRYGNWLCITEAHIVIYNRWGEKIFETDDATFKWDGTHKGKALNTEVIVYYMQVNLTDETEVIRKGNVSIIR